MKKLMIDLENELLNHYQISKAENEKYLIALHLPASLTYLQGHFPELPVLPAVAFIDISNFLLRKCFPLENKKMKSISSLKIKKIIGPEQVQISLQKLSEDHFQVDWQGGALLNVSFALVPTSRPENRHHSVF